MKSGDEKEASYEAMKGEYISLMASLEFELTLFIAGALEVSSHRQEFEGWFIRAPIPLGWKVSLFKALVEGNTMLDQFGDLGAQIKDLHEFRNTLAHSFKQLDSTITARGFEIPSEDVTTDSLHQRLEKLRVVESVIGSMTHDIMVGVIQPISSDDFADWPP